MWAISPLMTSLSGTSPTRLTVQSSLPDSYVLTSVWEESLSLPLLTQFVDSSVGTHAPMLSGIASLNICLCTVYVCTYLLILLLIKSV